MLYINFTKSINKMTSPINDKTTNNQKIPDSPAKTSKGIKITHLIEKIEEVCTRVLTPEFLTKKTKTTILAKVSPFTSPDDFKNKIKLAKQDIKLLAKFKKDREHLLNQVGQNLNTATSIKQKNSLKEQQDLLQEQSLRMDDAYAQAQAHLKYLQDLNKLQIGGRLTWHAGMAANFILPGSGVILGTALTTANTIAQEWLTDNLSAKEKTVTEEKKNIRFSTWTTLACTTASIFMGIYIMPTVKETAWHLWSNRPF